MMTHCSRESATLFLCTMLLFGCAHLSPNKSDWTYVRPPQPDEPARIPTGGVQCDSPEKAIFMATTGFFTDGCTSAMPHIGSYTVVSIEHIAQNDVRAWVVKATDAAGNHLWIPLPDHNWA
jgi:hypothetical protein